jgi:hypothetical protein
VQASLGAAQAEYRGLQLVLVNSRHQHVQRAEISGFQFQAVHRGLLNGEMLTPPCPSCRDRYCPGVELWADVFEQRAEAGDRVGRLERTV